MKIEFTIYIYNPEAKPKLQKIYTSHEDSFFKIVETLEKQNQFFHMYQAQENYTVFKYLGSYNRKNYYKANHNNFLKSYFKVNTYYVKTSA